MKKKPNLHNYKSLWRTINMDDNVFLLTTELKEKVCDRGVLCSFSRRLVPSSFHSLSRSLSLSLSFWVYT